MSAGHGYVCGTRGSGIVSSAADVLGMSVVRGMRGVGGMCMCLARGGRGEVRELVDTRIDRGSCVPSWLSPFQSC